MSQFGFHCIVVVVGTDIWLDEVYREVYYLGFNPGLFFHRFLNKTNMLIGLNASILTPGIHRNDSLSVEQVQR